MTPEFDVHAADYAGEVERAIAFGGKSHDFYTESKARWLLELVRRHVGEPRAVAMLDVGCGTGLAHRHLAPHLGRLEGVDVSPEMLATAAQTNPSVAYRAQQPDRLPYDDGAFDVATATCVLHHVPIAERAPLLREMARVVRPHGLIAVFEHNPLNPLTRLVVRRVSFDADAVLLRRGQLVRLFGACGIKPVESRYIMVLPVAGWVAGAFERALRGVPLGAQYVVGGRPLS